MCEALNITGKTTAAEDPWSNGLCERHEVLTLLSPRAIELKGLSSITSDRHKF